MLLPLALAISQAESFNAGLRKDFEILKSAYTQIHPGLYRYNTRAEMEARFAALSLALEGAKNRREAYRSISELTGAVKCGHSYPNFFNQPEEIVQEVFKGKNRLPFYFRWIGRKMIVVKDFTPEKLLSRGSEIESIDGTPADQVLRRLMPISRSDGGNDAKRIANLEVLGLDRFEAFDIYFPLYFDAGATFKLQVRSLDGKPKSVTADALTFEQRLAAHESREKSKAELGWEVRPLKPGYKLLRTPTWVMYNSKWNWQTFLAKTFDDLAKEKTKGLIIDIRGNEGGNSVGDVILAYLIREPMRFGAFQHFTRYRSVPGDLKPYLDTWDRTFDDWSLWSKDQRVPAGGTELFRMSRWDDAQGSTIKPRSPYFGGKVAVLVDSANSSATFEFVRMFREAKRGLLVGQPTGGNQRGINGSAFYFLRLPNSKIEVDIPLVAAINQQNVPDAGLEPDIRVKPSAREITTGRDSTFEEALKAISK